jgi:hypothetical protein
MKRTILAIAFLCVIVVGVVVMCVYALLPRGTKPSMTLHGVGGISSNMNMALNHLPTLKDAYQSDDSIVFPVALFNGALPLIMIHVGESGSRAAAIMDTGSEMLLLGDTERCTTCSTSLFGGAKGSDSAGDQRHGTGVIEFGSQKDHVEFRVEDIFIDGYQIRKLKFGLVTHRQSLTQETSITYNIMGIGGAQVLKHALLNEMHTKLRKNRPRVFGFMLGKTGNDYLDEEGVFVLGPIPKDLMNQDPIVRIPLHLKPLSQYYYTCHAEKILGHLKNGTDIVYPLTNFPVMFDSGSNYNDFPQVLSKQFRMLDTIEFVFPGNNRLVLPNSCLMWNRKPRSPLVNFSDTNIITIGTVALSKFKAFEFELDPVARLNIYARS